MMKSAQRMKKYVLKVEFEKLIFRIGFTVVTTCAKSCSKSWNAFMPKRCILS